VNFTFTKLPIPDVILVEPRSFGDERGYFMESYRESVFAKGGITARFVQDNRSFSQRAVLRGLHFQRAPFGQGKLVSVLQGEVFDVAVDLRPGSPTFGEWVGERISAENKLMIYVPEGFAHGFQVLSESALVHYKTTSEYAPRADAGVRWDDPDLAIPWPLTPPLLSPKDEALPMLSEVRGELQREDAKRERR
jgi:dTDP-4-dehydrorhamnose 3,5-epimerase